MPAAKDYDQWRRALIRSSLQARAADFAARYDPARPTVILLPGGMGSNLGRSTERFDAFDPSGSPPPVLTPVWADIGTILARTALKLEIGAAEHDSDDHIVVATGPFDFLFKAYDGTETWARVSRFNYAVFPYDWRRTVNEAASHLRDFLKQIQSRVTKAGHPDPLPRTTLLAHSMGGLVAKLALMTGGDLLSRIRSAVFVAVPFYGTWSHFHRYYDGEAMLSIVYGAAATARIIGSLPGPYILNYLDLRLWKQDGEALGLARYPFVDRHTGLACDPHDTAQRQRLPATLNFALLDAARKVRAALVKPVTAEHAPKLHFIYGDRPDTTPAAMSWEALSPSWRPGIDPAPVFIEALGPGDGTVPHWSAVPAQFRAPALAGQVRAIPFDHMSSAENSQVLDLVGTIAEGDAYAPVTPPGGGVIFGRSVKPNPDGLKTFLQEAAAGHVPPTDPRRTNAALFRAAMEAMTPC
jgi:pimeloyl-ACP methyl ester carboxylesterase